MLFTIPNSIFELPQPPLARILSAMTLVLLGVLFYRHSFNYSSYNPDNMLLSFGFRKNGTFDINVTATINPGPFSLLLATSDEAQKIYRHRSQLLRLCEAGGVALLNTSSLNGSAVQWKGSIKEDGVYNLFLLNSAHPRAVYSVEVDYQNPNSYLDSREDSIPQIYRILAAIQGLLGVFWLLNGLHYMNFRIPLHTIFCILPIVRMVSLFVTASKWDDLKATGTYLAWKEACQLLLEFVYYTLLFVGIAAACAGFCIFRNKLGNKDTREILVSSAMLTFGILATQHCPNFGFAIGGLSFTIFNLIWYFKHSIINLIIATNLLKLMKGDPHVYAKVRLSQNFVVSSFLTIIATLVSSLGAAGMEMELCVCAVILEGGLIMCTLLQQNFFMFRKKYSGDAEAPREPETVVEFPIIVEPRRSYLACMTTRL